MTEMRMEDKVNLLLDALIGIGAILLGAIARIVWMNFFSQTFRRSRANDITMEEIKNHRIFEKIDSFRKHYVFLIRIENPYKKYLAIKITNAFLKNLFDALKILVSRQNIEKIAPDRLHNMLKDKLMEKQITDLEFLEKIKIPTLKQKIEEYVALTNLRIDEAIEIAFNSKLYVTNAQKIYALMDMLSGMTDNKLLTLLVKNFFDYLNGEFEEAIEKNPKDYAYMLNIDELKRD